MKKNKLFLTAGIAAVLAIGIFIYALNNSKFEVKFDTDGGNKIEAVTVKKNERVEAPKDPKKKGYVFVEWQKEGKTYDFKKKVTENMTLKAKWLPEIYVTITLDSNGGSEVEAMKIISGTKLSKDDIENPTREGYTFAGWLVGENKYDFSKKITSNLTLTASWVEGENVELPDEEEAKKVEEEKKAEEEAKKVEEEKKAAEEAKKAEEEKKAEKEKKAAEEKKKKETSTKEEKKETSTKEEKKETLTKEEKKETSTKEEKKETSTNTVTTTFKVGDYVIITGDYAGSCDGENPGNNAAMGWDRQILAVYENQEYPYQVGNKFGTTGYFKADSLKLKD